MLTVDYGRLGLRPGDRVLDLGCGGGRHAFGALRLGARVVALDADDTEVKGALELMQAMRDEGEGGTSAAGTATVGDAVSLPFRDATFDRVIAAEVLEHVPADRVAIAELARVLRPGGTMAVTVPRWYPELICWALSDEYHSVDGGHVRIYRERVLRGRLSAAGLRRYDRHHAHALHTPYWWLKCIVGTTNESHPLVRQFHRLLVWDIVSRPLLTRFVERALNPVLGKSLVIYASKPAVPS